MARLFGLADCNNFFVSCEKAFRPDLARRPVVVLSNNDGCVVSRSAEVKALGIPMGAPRFQIEDQIRRHGIAVFSSNFSLYGDMSGRIMRTLRMFAPSVEQYSIDEAFFNAWEVPAIRADPVCAGRQIRDYILKTTGIPVSIGFAPSRTLSKLANYYVKKHPETGGVMDLSDPDLQHRLLAVCPLEDVWGIGSRLLEKLRLMGISTPWELAASDPDAMRRRFGINMQRTILELNGVSCFEFEDSPAVRKSVVHSSTMSEPSDMLRTVSEAVCSHTASAAAILRQDGLAAGVITVFIRTGFYREDQLFHSASLSARPDPATSDTRVLMHLALDLLRTMWRQGPQYSKVGVMLTELTGLGGIQQSLFSTHQDDDGKGKRLMEVMDRINASGGPGVFFLGQGTPASTWKSSRKFRSPCYTTCWDDVIRVH